MISALYTLVIYPIELFLEVVFSVFYDLRHSAAFAIVGVSLVVNFLLLPLYNRADRLSKEERDRQAEMACWTGHIRRVFQGDERFMILQAYYRKKGYHPVYALRSSISLLLQIPFFIAAYHFLSGLSLLNGYPFHWIRDLGQPDGMLVLGGITINVLPVLMTLINIISTVIYTKESSLREKLQLYIMALLFLVLLYNSPSGLVLYWTMNNLFSLAKNIVAGFRKEKAGPDKEEKTCSSDRSLYLKGVLLLTLLTGLVIPLSVVVSSPAEFVSTVKYLDPLHYVLAALLMSAGLFLIWFSVFYYLMEDRARRITELLLWLVNGMALVDFLYFGKVPMTISPELVYKGEFVIEPSRIALNLAVLALLACLLLLISHFRRGWMKHIYRVLLAGLAVLAVFHTVRTERKLNETGYLKEKSGYEGFTLSKHGKNVVLIMLDCGMGPYVPYIFEEKPELKESFRGFVYYPNTISHGAHTIIGSPGLFGGYEYTPEGMDSRPEEKLVDKHDEALSVLPVLFSENGYRTTVYDPPLARYEDRSDLSIYDPYPEIRAYSLKNRFVSPESFQYTETYRKRQFFMYSIFKISPLFLQPFIYRGGTYHYPDAVNSSALGNVNTEFNDSYSILEHFRDLTEISDSDGNTFMMMDNDITHDQTELQLPDYIPSEATDNSGLETDEREDWGGNVLHLTHREYYHVNMAALLKIGEWLDYLKENGVYDNTRIIITSDHGAAVGEEEALILSDGTDAEGFYPLLMVKDFNARSFEVSETFMTNADSPALAVKEIIPGPENPFTGNRLDGHEKSEREQLVFGSDFDDTDAYVFPKREGERWYRVRDDMRKSDDWSRVQDYEE